MKNFRRDSYESLGVFTRSGEAETTQYELVPDAKSDFEIQPARNKYKLDEYIQSFRDVTDFKKIIERFKDGDLTAVPDSSNLSYGDTTRVPDNIFELDSRIQESYKFFESLPDDIRSQFRDINDFYASVGTDKFIKAFQKNVDKTIKKTENIAKEQPTGDPE